MYIFAQNMHKYTMSVKTQRLIAIRKIITSQKISTQEELLLRLGERGFELTQATLSRDLKFLKVGKSADPEKGYVYFLPESSAVSADPAKRTATENFMIDGFMSLKFSNNLGVIKTKAGYASSIASLIDSRNLYEILATIAGDDTILLIPVDGVGPQDIKNAIVMIMPDLEGRI